MGNIYTSFLRIARPDRGWIGPDERASLVRELCQAYGGPGSYWVRIGAVWQGSEGCLDLQFGSSKTGYTADYLLHRPAFHARFDAWIRLASNSGWPDTIARAGVGEPRPCRYAFDAVRLSGSSLPMQLEVDGDGLARIGGTYTASNGRGFVDLGPYGSPFYGPSLQHDPDRPFDPHALTPGAYVVEIDPSWLGPLLAATFARGDGIELMFGGRVVHRAAEARSGADGWDNVVDEEFAAWRG